MKKIILIVILFFLACDQECDPEQSRCADNAAEICDGDGEWATVTDCAALGPAWACVYVEAEDLHTCIISTDGGPLWI